MPDSTPDTPTQTPKTSDKGTQRLMVAMLAMMTLLVVIVGWAIAAGNNAALAGARATKHATDAATALSVHEARQNGTLESINSQLSTLRTYHSTLRGELKEQRKLLDDLLKQSHVTHKQAD